MVKVFKNYFLCLRTKNTNKTCLGSGCTIVPTILRVFKVSIFREQKAPFPSFILFKEHKNKLKKMLFVFLFQCSLCSHIWFLLEHVYNWVSISIRRRSTLSPPTYLIFPLFPNILKLFFSNSEKLVGKKSWIQAKKKYDKRFFFFTNFMYSHLVLLLFL